MKEEEKLQNYKIGMLILIGVCATVEQVRSKKLEQGCKMDPRFICSGVDTDNRCMDGCQIYSFHWNISVWNGNWTVFERKERVDGSEIYH